MSATPPNLGVAASSPAPPKAAAWPDAAQLRAASTPVPVTNAATWPRPALWIMAVLLGGALALMAWNIYGSSRWATRPATLEHGAVQTSRLDLNRADRVQLMQLPGLGETLAARIEAYRDEHNGFQSVEDLRQVPGIGPAHLEKLRPHVCVVPFEAAGETKPREEPRRPALPISRPARNTPPNKPATKKISQLNGPIDINRASAEELQRLPGIGPTLSERIVETRRKGLFTKVDDLRRVSGIGVKTLDRLRPFVTVGEAADEEKE